MVDSKLKLILKNTWCYAYLFFATIIKMRDLPRASRLVITVYSGDSAAATNISSSSRTPIGWAAANLFCFDGCVVTVRA